MEYLDNKHFVQMLISASNNLENKYHEIDTLNVFPVPDGDTGTNMFMTFSNGVKVIKENHNDHIGETAKILSKAMLMNARGNSGVILSQIFKGLANVIVGKKEVNAKDLSEGFMNGARIAYKAVMRPTEGTILTVAREASDYGMFYVENHPNATIEEYFEYIYTEAAESLNHTPELLPVLKEVGVVDSGGAGIVAILEGIALYCQGKPVQLKENVELTENTCGFSVWGQIRLTSFNASVNFDAYFNSLAKSCDNVAYNRQGNILTFSLVTNLPVDIIAKMQKFGTFVDIEVHNLSKKESTEKKEIIKEKIHEKNVFIAVVNGEGIKKMFEDLRCHYFVIGGQTMNPSTQDFVNLINNEIDADEIYLLPNNKNIILAANQVSEVLTNKNIHVINSKSIPEGISALMNFNEKLSVEKNMANMQQAMENVSNGSITFAIKDTTYNEIDIKAGNYIGIANRNIVISNPSIEEVIKCTIDNLVSNDSSFISIIYGKDINETEAMAVGEFITNNYDIDVEVSDGGQELYPYIFGVE